MDTAMKWVLYLLTVVLIVLHQDFWNWKTVNPMLFGFMPVGLWYHAAFCVAAAVLLALYVAFLWPKHLEDVQPEPGVEVKNRSGH
jgi:hypothetical protein